MENSNLADRFFYAKRRLEEVEAEVDALRQEIIDTGKTRISGKEARVTIKISEFNRFSVSLAKGLMTARQIAECTKTSKGHTVRVAPLSSKADLFG